jgi:hypothetical protein
LENKINGRYTVDVLKSSEKASRSHKNIVDKTEYVIDASDPFCCYARFANCPPIGLSNNANLQAITHTAETRHLAVELWAGSLPIKAGDEIFVNYGGEYWLQDARLKANKDPSRKLSKLLAINEETKEQSVVNEREKELQDDLKNLNREFEEDRDWCAEDGRIYFFCWFVTCYLF